MSNIPLQAQGTNIRPARNRAAAMEGRNAMMQSQAAEMQMLGQKVKLTGQILGSARSQDEFNQRLTQGVEAGVLTEDNANQLGATPWSAEYSRELEMQGLDSDQRIAMRSREEDRTYQRGRDETTDQRNVLADDRANAAAVLASDANDRANLLYNETVRSNQANELAKANALNLAAGGQVYDRSRDAVTDKNTLIEQARKAGVEKRAGESLKVSQAAETRQREKDERGAFEKKNRFTRAVSSATKKQKTVAQNIAKAREIMNRKGILPTYGYGAWAAQAAPGDARELSFILKTLQSNIGFQSLEDIKASSPAGGGVGALSEREFSNLAAMQGDITIENPNLPDTINNIEASFATLIPELETAARDYDSLDAAPSGGWRILGVEPVK